VLSFVLGIKLVDRKLHRQTLVSAARVYDVILCWNSSSCIWYRYPPRLNSITVCMLNTLWLVYLSREHKLIICRYMLPPLTLRFLSQVTCVTAGGIQGGLSTTAELRLMTTDLLSIGRVTSLTHQYPRPRYRAPQ